jgi:hypothetical protein
MLGSERGDRLEKADDGRLVVRSSPWPDERSGGAHGNAPHREVEAFANWFVDWWLRRGRCPQPPDERQTRPV